MKKVIKILLTIIIVSINSCTKEVEAEDPVVVEEVDDSILYVIEVENVVWDPSDPSSEFSVVVGEIDFEDGGSFQQLDLSVSFKDLTPDNGTTTIDKINLKTIPASEFILFSNGELRGNVSVAFVDAIAAMGLSDTDYSPGDLIVFDLELVISDGRIFNYDNPGDSLNIFNPFQYDTLVVGCVPASGDYIVDMQDVFGDGWQTDQGIVVSIDGIEIDILLDDPTSSEGRFILNVPMGTQELLWYYTGDEFPEEVSFQIIGPNGDVLGDFQEIYAGILPILSCL